MTAAEQTRREKSAVFSKKSRQRVGYCLMSIFLLALFFKNSDIALRAMSEGLSLCVRTLVPSLFPFMVASDLLVSIGGIGNLGFLLDRPFRAIFGMSGTAACAVLLGFVCGFPVGTRCAVMLYRNNLLTEREFSRALAFSNHPSASFLINTVGLSMFGSQAFGLLLYAITLLSSLLLQVLQHIFDAKKYPLPPPCAASLTEETPISFPSALTHAVSGAASALLPICAFVVFFSTVVESLSHLTSALSLPPTLTALLFSLFELTGGVSRAVSLPRPMAMALCAFSVGWGGLSVHFQLLHLVGEHHFFKRSYFLTKLLHGLLNIPLLSLFCRVMKIE